jgi:hypothetical protein
MLISLFPRQTRDEKAVSHGWISRPILSMSEVALIASARPWTSCLWRDGRRLQVNWTGAWLAALDFDSPGCMTLAEAVAHFAPYIHFIGTTKSHHKEKVSSSGKIQPACDRYRVVIPFDGEIKDIKIYQHNIQRLCNLFDADRACCDAVDFFWPCIDIVSISDTGKKQPIFAPPPERPQTSNRARRYSGAGHLPPDLEARLKIEPALGERNFSSFDLAKYLAKFVDESIVYDMILASPAGRWPNSDKEAKELKRCIKRGCYYGGQNRYGTGESKGHTRGPRETGGQESGKRPQARTGDTI